MFHLFILQEYKIKEDKYNEEDAKKARTAKAKTLATLIRSPLNKSLKRSREPKLENISTETIIMVSYISKSVSQ